MFFSLILSGYSAPARQRGEESDRLDRLLFNSVGGERKPVVMCISILIARERAGKTSGEAMVATVCKITVNGAFI
jgi:hypothetical protein